jgi:phage N-6-adenine-methyltransferase
MIVNEMMSSTTHEWATPQALFDELNAEFSFTLDVCASDWNHKCADYFTIDQDGLKQEWSGVCWMNPPYGRTIGKWMAKAVESAQGGATVVCLVPARTDTAWWWDYAMLGEIRFIRRRIKFINQHGLGKEAPFPSAVVIFNNMSEWRK